MFERLSYAAVLHQVCVCVCVLPVGARDLTLLPQCDAFWDCGQLTVSLPCLFSCIKVIMQPSSAEPVSRFSRICEEQEAGGRG